MKRTMFTDSILILSSAMLLSGLSCNRSGGDKSKGGFVNNYSIYEIWRSDTSFRTPESVIYDDERDVLYVSNVNMEPRKKDGNGFISRLDTAGKIIDLRWIEGLNAPKGSAIAGDTLFVADIDELVLIDIPNSKIVRKLTLGKMGMLNDISSGESGELYISDTDSNKIYKYNNGKLSVWLTEGFNRPNGLLAEKERLLIASQGSSDLIAVDLTSGENILLADSLNRADGIAFTGTRDYYFVTDWNGEIFMIKPGGIRTSLLKTSNLPVPMNTADCSYITNKNLLLVPTFFSNCIVAYRLKKID